MQICRCVPSPSIPSSITSPDFRYVGGFIAIPALLMLYAVLRNLVPGIIQVERTS